MGGVISYNSEALLQKKRVLYEPAVSTETLKAGYVVCYNNDRLTNLAGTSVAEGSQNPARFLQVEKPKTANLKFVAGIVCPESEGAAYGEWINIYLLNGADIPVWSEQNCVNGTTTLAVTDDEYIAEGTDPANVALGLAKETVNRSGIGDAGLVLMKSFPTAGVIGDAAAVSAALSTLSLAFEELSDAYSALSVGELDDISDLASANSVAIASVAADVATESAMQSSIITDILLTSSLVTDVLSSVTINTAEIDAISDMQSSLITDITDIVTEVDAISDMQSSLITDIASLVVDVSQAKESAMSHISVLEDWTSDALSVITDMQSSLITDITAIETYQDTVSSLVTDVLSSVTINTAEIDAISDMQSSLITDITDIVTEIDAVSDMQSSLITDLVDLDNDATSVIASANISSATHFHVHFLKITLADGTSFSCVADVLSA